MESDDVKTRSTSAAVNHKIQQTFPMILNVRLEKFFMSQAVQQIHAFFIPPIALNEITGNVLSYLQVS